ncbi:hypothetical protein EV368DRAFT_53046 [Lentinula lateritia]|nr:hypothetical protein EV368DRAFT_53046 [Lentinula lateritia]
MQIKDEPPNRIVCGDEAAVNIHTTYRENGWSMQALTMDGIIFSNIKLGSYSGDEFLFWLDGLLEVMNPYPGRHSVLVLDNCRIHHVPGVEERCQAR